MDLLQEHFEFQQLLVQVDGRVRDVQKVSGYIFRRIWKSSGFAEYYQSGGLSLPRTSNGAKDRFYIRRIIFEATGVQAFTVIKAFYNLLHFRKL